MQSAIRSGTVIAGFRVTSVVGEGAMGAVYLAEEPTGGRRVALKMLTPELARDERFRQRFLRESELAGTLDHPHIVPTVRSGPRDPNELVVANENGGAARRLTQPLLNGPQGDHSSTSLVFTPDGKRIAYVKRLGHKAAVFVMNAKGAGVKQLTSFRMGVDDRLDWSPDGAKILFSDNLQRVDLYTVRANGTGLTQITHSTGANYSAKSWSPDGKQILFVLGRPGVGRSLYVMNADGGEMKQVMKGLLVEGGSWGTHQ